MRNNALEEFYSIIRNSPVRLFEPEEGTDPDWCPWARQLLEFGERLISWVEVYPSAEVIARGREKLDKRYREARKRAPVEHRDNELNATHACLDRARRDLAQQLEDAVFAAPVTGLVAAGAKEKDSTHEPPLDDVRDAIFGHKQPEETDREDDPNS